MALTPNVKSRLITHLVSSGQIDAYRAPYNSTTDGAVAQCWGTFGATTEMSTRKEENLRFIIHTDLTLQSLVIHRT